MNNISTLFFNSKKILALSAMLLAMFLFFACTESEYIPPPMECDVVLNPDDILTGNYEEGEEVCVYGTVKFGRYVSTHPDRYLVNENRFFALELSDANSYISINKELARKHFTIVFPPEYYDEQLRPLPRKQDEVIVKGLVHYNEDETWYEINPVTDMHFVEEANPRALAGLGESCDNDMQCIDNLICYRDHTCGRVRQVWGFQGCEGTECDKGLTEGIRRNDLYGTCTSDEECPLGQECRTDVTDPLEPRDEVLNPYGVQHQQSVSINRYLCYPENAETSENLSPEEFCEHIYDTEEFLSGRFASGKDICVQSTVLFPIPAADGDTHIQLDTEFKMIYPVADFDIDTVGVAAETVPPYKDPDNPIKISSDGHFSIGDPGMEDEVVVMGTVRWDPAHGWWEIHPVKWLKILSTGSGGGLLEEERPDPAELQGEFGNLNDEGESLFP